MQQHNTTNHSFLMAISMVSAMGGLLFGYDWVVIGGAKPFYEAFFNMADQASLQGWVMSSAVLGCLIGVMVSGSLSDRFGRRPLLFAASLLFIVSAIGTGMVHSLSWFVVYRIVGGVGIGIASNVSPMYIAEVSPGKVRGRFVSLQQMTIVFGILFAQIINWLIADPVAEGADLLSSWNGQWAWRWMFWAEVVPALLFFLLLYFIPESPRWLAVQGRFDQASGIFAKIGGTGYAESELTNVKAMLSREGEKSQVRMLFQGKLPQILLIGIVIAVFQQWCGINVILTYAEEVFSAAGYAVSDILFNIVITGVTNVLFTFVGMYTVDRLGRRSLLLFGSIGLALVYAALGACYYHGITGVAVLVLVMAAIAMYAMTLAPVVWVVLSELFPNRIRGMAMAISTFALWTGCMTLTYTFPLLNRALGASGTFWLYGAVCLVGYLYILLFLPETKGKTLEEIERTMCG